MTISSDVERPAGRPLTGRHVLIMIVSFFTVVFTVNMIMLRAATSTFGGLETDGAYRAGLSFNKELAAARVQDERGWTVEARPVRDASGVGVTVDVRDKAGVGVTDLEGTVLLARPADRREDRKAALLRDGDGRYRAALGDLDPGQWNLVIQFERDGERVFLSRSRVVLN